MGLISKAGWIGVGYVLGARAGTGRYDQIVAAARKIVGRPELQAYLKPLADRLEGHAAAHQAAPEPGPARPGQPAPLSPSPMSPSPVSPGPVSSLAPPRSGTVPPPSAAPDPAPGPVAARPSPAAPGVTPTPAAVPGRGRLNKRRSTS